MKTIRVSLTATAKVSSSVELQVSDRATDSEIQAKAQEKAAEGDLVWKYEGVDDGSFEVGVIY